MKLISPSILCADFLHLGEICHMLNESNAHWFHLDIMDGMFVPNISFGMPVIEAIRKSTGKTLDAHLMIEKPERYITRFRDTGVDRLSFHVEATDRVHSTVQSIKDAGMKAGVALCPATPLCMVEDILPDLDYVLLMSVNPGFGGQKFIPGTIDRIKRLRSIINDMNCKALIQVDGGINPSNAALLYASGADCLVAGNAVFNSDDPVKTIDDILGI